VPMPFFIFFPSDVSVCSKATGTTTPKSGLEEHHLKGVLHALSTELVYRFLRHNYAHNMIKSRT
jgi:hypothetical protein